VFIFGKIKTYIIAALAMAIPIIYVMGKVMGASKEKNKVIKDELQASEKAGDFYKAMAENETNDFTDRKSVTDRLRSNGL
tara:strand:+ start:581 stop:820 length:240 start_codon:yes stop_codon:yes gene_type:complete